MKHIEKHTKQKKSPVSQKVRTFAPEKETKVKDWFHKVLKNVPNTLVNEWLVLDSFMISN